MKKSYLFLAAIASIALVSCSNEEFVSDVTPPNGNGPLTKISFNTEEKGVTRAEHTGKAAADSLRNNFVVMGVKTVSSTTSTVFDHYNVNYTDGTSDKSTTNTKGWEYVGYVPNARASIPHTESDKQTIKYWDYSATQYDFIAFSSGSATAVYADASYNSANNVLYSAITPADMKDKTKGAYTIKGSAKNLTKTFIADLTTAYNPDDYKKEVTLKFRTLSAKVRIGLFETIPGYSVKDVVFYTDASTVATDGNAYLYTSGSGNVFNTEGTCIVYYKTTGSDNKNDADYNKAHIAFTPAESGTANKMSFGAFAYNASTNTTFESNEKNEATGNYLGRASNDATYSGKNTTSASTPKENYYTLVLPNEDGAVLNLKVNYTLVSTDGSGETITVTGATATVPDAYTQWKSGYAYTYLFKISDNTNGQTGTGTTPAGLYPITFDAVVIETEEGIQETITTVSEPSITTFGVKDGKYVASSNDYAAGTDIYVTIMDNGSVVVPTPHTNFHLYRNIVSSDANFLITEASVKQAIEVTSASHYITFEHPCAAAENSADLTWFNTNCTAVTSVPAENGGTKDVNAVKLKGLAAGVYAVEYRKSDDTPGSAEYYTRNTVETIPNGESYITYDPTQTNPWVTSTNDTGSDLTPGITYFTRSGEPGNYTYTVAGATLTADIEYWYYDGNGEGGGWKSIGAAVGNETNGISIYTRHDAVAPTVRDSYYKVIIVH